MQFPLEKGWRRVVKRLQTLLNHFHRILVRDKKKSANSLAMPHFALRLIA